MGERGYTAAYMSDRLNQLILQTLHLLADSDTETEEDIVRGLCESGVKWIVAEKLAVLVPIAYGRVLLAHHAKLTFSDTFQIYSGEELVSRALETEPIFRAACLLASDMYHNGPRSLFKPASAWSAEVIAVSSALSAGANLSRGTLSAPTFFRVNADDWDGSGGSI